MYSLSDLLIEIKNSISNKDYTTIDSKVSQLIYKLKKDSLTIDESDFNDSYSLAVFLYKNKYHKSCLYLLKALYKFNKTIIKNFINTFFINPHKNEYIQNYYFNADKYKDLNITYPQYEDLKLDFIKIEEDRYFIFDLEDDSFGEIIDFSNECLSETIQYKNNDEFSDMLLIDGFNINTLKNYIKFLNNKTSYYLSLNPQKSFSFLKLPQIFEKLLNNLIIFNSVSEMQKYFRNNLDISIPHTIISANDKISLELKDSIKDILDIEHSFRLTNEGRSMNNIILSICIPTWNRGNLALEKINNLLQCNYDCEIEFVVSNNGSTKYKNDYELIKNCTDSRINYFEFNENKGGLMNFLNVINICNGRYALLMSDEDSVVLESLPHYMNILRNNKSIGMIRSATSNIYENIQDNYFKAGYTAFHNFFLSNNYISGSIYNKLLFEKYNLSDITLANLNNESCIHYPHMWWDAFLSLKADCIKDSTVLCIEGKSVIQEQIREGILEKDKSTLDNVSLKLNGMPRYQTYESRIKQHYGFIELINLLKFDTVDNILLAYSALSWKTNFLVSLVKDKYRENNYDINNIYDELLICTISGIKNLNISIPQKYSTLLRHQIIKYNLQFR